jgi:molybdopterin/thiamine biosynthesis adenylyltransferase/nitroreductase
VAGTIDLLPGLLEELRALREPAPPAVDPGCWVFYPWSGRLVRTLRPDLWQHLRSDRNRYKLTAAEQQRLRGATIAVAGLSVGAAVVQVLALEGTGGVLRLADADVLAGSNCNRLRAALWDLGQPKVVLAARMVWELDPFRSIEVMKQPVGPANVARFLDGVDVVVEECDDFPAKVLIRREARRREIPVVMATSEGGLLDVERFDIEPARSLFHGLAPQLESTDLASVSTDERIRLALQIIGPEHMSDRSAASMIELDRTVSSWPQLAGDVAAGGAHAAAAVRRIVLGQPCPSGRYHLDVDRALASGPATGTSSATPRRQPRRRERRTTVDPFVEQMLAAATSAPSAGNAQPWRFGWDGRRLRIWLDRGRATNSLDPERTAGWVAIGAACENVTIAAAGHGRPARFEWFPDADDPDLAGVVTFPASGEAPPSGDDARLSAVLHRRATDRGAATAPPLADEDECALRAAAAVHGAAVHIVRERSDIERFGALVGASDRRRLLDPTLHRELVDELRWTPAAAMATGDGIDVASLGLEPGGIEALRLMTRPEVAAFLARHGLGSRLTEVQRRALSATSALALVTVDGHTPADRVRGGRAVQRVWLEATTRHVAVQPVTPMTLFGESKAGELAALFASGVGHPILVLRLHGGSCVPPPHARRRPVHDVLHTEEMT